jgi:hypothetical protein
VAGAGVIPATAAVLNLLAAAASSGVPTAFFQWDWAPMREAWVHLSRDSNWLLPRWLDRRLPHLAVEPGRRVSA